MMEKHSSREIAAQLNSAGYRSRRGNDFTNAQALQLIHQLTAAPVVKEALAE
ncbi:hypothetical protein HER32_17535 [Hymenobacter sp. BT18]|nr:hypothetical protein HER32_17535 [Hymenobacter sp. BT18]